MKTTRREMIEDQIIKRGIKDPLVINAMMEVDRKVFVPEGTFKGTIETRRKIDCPSGGILPAT